MAHIQGFHYTKPINEEMIELDGLQPMSEQPGTGELVTYAFLDEPQYAWYGDGRHDTNTGLITLKQIMHRGHDGLTLITFDLPDTTHVFDREAYEHADPSAEAYAKSGVSLDEHLRNPRRQRRPEAVITVAIPPEQLRFRRFTRAEMNDRFADWGI